MTLLDLPYEEWTCVHAVRAQALARGQAPYLSFEGGGDLTYADLDRASDAVATALADLGVEAGDRVLGLLTNSRAFMVLMVAVHKRRAIWVPINTELKGAFLEHQVENSEPRVIISDAELLPLFEHVDTTSVAIETTVVVGDAEAPFPNALATTRRVGYDELEATTIRPEAVVTPSPQDTCTIMYTSGTTGPSKGVLMPQAHCYLFGLGGARAMELTPDDRYYVCMPLFHANALFMQTWACLFGGGSGHVVKRFSASRWLDDVIEHEVTVSMTLGVIPEFIYRLPPTEKDRAHKVRRVFAVPVATEWEQAFTDRFGIEILQGFGMTEINMVAYSDVSEPNLAGRAGYVLPEFDVIVADPATDAAVPAGQTGEILVRPRLPFCFNVGYFKMPEKTVEAWRNLWFHTGDAGMFDEEGRLHYIDRLNDRLRRRGENISSYEIEQVLNSHTSITESAAIGVKVADAGGEEEIKVVLALEPGHSIEPVDLLDWCSDLMPRYSVPRYIEVVPELEKTASGKIRKQAMRDLGITPTTWDRESVGYVVRRTL